MTRIKMHISKVKLPFYPPCQVKCRLQNGVLTTILGIWWLSPLGSLWLIVSGSIRSRLALMGPLSAIMLVLLQKVLHKSMKLIMKKPLLRLLEYHLFVLS